MRLGARIIGLREEKGWDQIELASQSGVAQSSLSNIETGESEKILAKTLLALCSALDANPFYVFTGKGEKTMRLHHLKAEQQCLALFQQLTPTNQEALITVGRALLEGQPPSPGRPSPEYQPKSRTQ